VKRWFLPDVPDLLGQLRDQAAITQHGVDRFAAWCRGEAAAGEVREFADESHDACREVRKALRSAFSTPLDPEDIYELSERMDDIVNSLKDIVREAELIAMPPDHQMVAMADHIVSAQRHLGVAFGALDRDDDVAAQSSDEAIGSCRELEDVYRAAMSDLLAVTDLREVMGRRELYRRCARTADAVERVAERIWFVVVKAP